MRAHVPTAIAADSGDHAAIASIRSACGAPVEVMRTSYRTQVFPKHTHEFYTVGLVLRGPGTLWYRSATHLTEPGDVVVIPPGEVHTGALGPGAERLSYLAVHVPASVLADHATDDALHRGDAPEFDAAIIRDADVAAALAKLERATLSCCGDVGGEAESLATAIGLLLARHARASARRSTLVDHDEPRLVHQARELLDDCYSDNTHTSLEALAARTGVTPFHLVRVFTRTVGISPHRYLVQTRLRHAAELLALGTPCSFVAAMTGFADQSHLTTQFKRYVGITPVSYQRAVLSR